MINVNCLFLDYAKKKKNVTITKMQKTRNPKNPARMMLSNRLLFFIYITPI